MCCMVSLERTTLVYINGEVAGDYTSGATDAYDTYKTSTIASALYDDIVAWQATAGYSR